MLCSSPEWLYDVGSAMAYAVILPGRCGRPRGSLPSALRPVVLFFLWFFFVCVVSVEVAVLLLFRLLFFVVCLAAFPLLSGWSSCSWLSRWIPLLPGDGCGIVSSWQVASEFFFPSQLLIQEDAERRELTQTALSGGAPGS